MDFPVLAFSEYKQQFLKISRKLPMVSKQKVNYLVKIKPMESIKLKPILNLCTCFQHVSLENVIIFVGNFFCKSVEQRS